MSKVVVTEKEVKVVSEGKRGYSAYEVAKANGYTGTEAQWLASLIGAKGDKGDTGDLNYNMENSNVAVVDASLFDEYDFFLKEGTAIVGKSINGVKILLGINYDVNPAMTAAQIQAVIDEKSSGQTVKFAPGTYELGNNSLIIKNGVNINCGVAGSVTINSSSINGTLTDNNNPVVMSITGFPVITNTNGSIYYLVQLKNLNSWINDHYLEATMLINQSGTDNPVIIRTIKNTTGLNISFTRTDVGSYSYIFTSKTDYILKFYDNSLGYDGGIIRKGVLSSGRDNGMLVLYTFSAPGVAADAVLSNFLIAFKIYFGRIS